LKIFHSDAYKEFEKEIQEDLQEVDDRLEEEEVGLTCTLLPPLFYCCRRS
jgi:hypothetical protein